MVGRCSSNWNSPTFKGDMLVFGGCRPSQWIKVVLAPEKQRLLSISINLTPKSSRTLPDKQVHCLMWDWYLDQNTIFVHLRFPSISSWAYSYWCLYIFPGNPPNSAVKKMLRIWPFEPTLPGRLVGGGREPSPGRSFREREFVTKRRKKNGRMRIHL